jgi:VIT1/CCC1 family predicted Fe2+/Mn2+ transporter
VSAVAANESTNELRERPLGEVAKELTSDLSLLVRQEIQLARAELTDQGKAAAPAGARFGGAAVAGLCTLGALTAFLVLVLSLFLDAWLAALIVTVVLGAVAFVLVRQGRQILARAMARPPLEETIDTVKEDVEWAKTRAASARS